MTEQKQEKWIKEGRGTGVGKEYKPWLTIQDVSSDGRATRLRGIKTERQHELLSDLERSYLYIVEYANCVIDLREQYPLLPLEQTLLIADEIGVKHPTDPKTQFPVVMSTDFLLTIEHEGTNKLLARTIKSKDDLMNARQIEKFEIERRYWQCKEVNWRMVTDQQINKTLAKNISLIHPYYDLSDLDVQNVSDIQKDQLVQHFKSKIEGKQVIIREASARFDEQMMLPEGTGLSIFKHLLITKQINIDLFQPLDIDSSQEIIESKNAFQLGADAI